MLVRQQHLFTWRLSIMVTKTKSVTKPVTTTKPLAMYFISSEEQEAVIVTEFDYKELDMISASSANAEKNMLMRVFANEITPTFADYQAWYKATNKKTINSKTAGQRPNYLMFNNIAKIQEAQALGFNALSYWNEFAKTKTRKTLPTIQGGILQGARDFLNGAKPEVSPEEKAGKYAVTFYNAIQNCKGKKWQIANDKMVALMSSLGIAIPEPKTETDTE
jgi:hypothetical protein